MADLSRRILCYGDSNTWGYMPGTGERYPADVRWTGRLQALLGPDYTVLEEGLNGRTTVYDDPINPYRNGLVGLGYVLQAAKPVDLAVLCLGTNDLHFTDVRGAARGIGEILRTVQSANAIYQGSTPVFRREPRILLIAPPHLDAAVEVTQPDSLLRGKVGESLRFAPLYRAAAARYGAAFLDAAAFAKASKTDGIHLDAPSHRALADAVAAEIRRMFG